MMAGLGNRNIIGTNILTKFHEHRKINWASRVLTRNKGQNCHKTSPPASQPARQPASPPAFANLITSFFLRKTWLKMPCPLAAMFFNQPASFFELFQDIIGMNLLTKFHEDRTVNVASRPFFSGKYNYFELIQDIIETNLLTKCHEDWTINVASRVLTRKNATPLCIGMNLLTKFYEDQTITVASRVKNAPPLGSHVFQANVTIFELIQDIIETNLLTKFHEDWTINVDSRELTRQMLTPHNRQKAITKAHHEHIVLR
ncbi:hypothetical protein DPMN_001017 [Dreissena polymorpha]|uniref:Uncharacterized protein n=1 Tax=Dreissena polymorpha TaxID=45954 RepID=A0A9D4MH00_DREPO|nr:hypothetical protein DPMN_001017 [Dreissena polymorpha]